MLAQRYRNTGMLIPTFSFFHKFETTDMTISFSNSSPKIPKQGIFGLKFKEIYFRIKLCNETNLRALISNMTILFSNPSPKIPITGIFSPKFKDFYFCTKLCNKTNSKALISNMTIIFQNYCPKHPNKAFLVPNLRIFIFARNFAIRQVRGC